jgi:hypothetical protein
MRHEAIHWSWDGGDLPVGAVAAGHAGTASTQQVIRHRRIVEAHADPTIIVQYPIWGLAPRGTKQLSHAPWLSLENRGGLGGRRICSPRRRARRQACLTWRVSERLNRPPKAPVVQAGCRARPCLPTLSCISPS